jgi:hypothetical protein
LLYQKPPNLAAENILYFFLIMQFREQCPGLMVEEDVTVFEGMQGLLGTVQGRWLCIKEIIAIWPILAAPGDEGVVSLLAVLCF